MPEEIRPEDIIAIQQAVEQYGRNRRTLEKLLDEGKLSLVKIEGDRRTYLVRSELDAMFTPRIVKPAKHTKRDQDAG